MTNEKDQEITRKSLSVTLFNFAPYFAGALALAIAVAVGAWGYHAYQESLELKAEEELYSFESQIESIEQKLYESQLEKAGESTKAELPSIEKTPESFDKNFSGFIGAFEAAIIKNKGTRAGAVSAIHLADKYSEYELNDKAINLLQVMGSDISNDLLKALLVMQKVSLQKTSDDCSSLISEIDAITKKESLKFLWPEAYLRKAACAMSTQNTALATQALEKLSNEFSDSSAYRKSQVLQRLLATQKREGA